MDMQTLMTAIAISKAIPGTAADRAENAADRAEAAAETIEVATVPETKNFLGIV